MNDPFTPDGYSNLRQNLPRRAFFKRMLTSAGAWAPVHDLFSRDLPAADLTLQMNPAWIDLSRERALEILKAYFFWVSFVVFPAYVILRLMAARIYASGLLSALQKGAIHEDALGEVEWEAFHRLDLLQIQPQPVRHVFVRIVAWAGTRAGRTTASVLIALVWFTFVAQIFATEFLNYHPGVGWLNQPLVQLPWFRYIPAQLK